MDIFGAALQPKERKKSKMDTYFSEDVGRDVNMLASSGRDEAFMIGES